MIRPRRIKRITATERDEITADVKALLVKHQIGPTTLQRFAEMASREMVE